MLQQYTFNKKKNMKNITLLEQMQTRINENKQMVEKGQNQYT